MEAAGEAFPPPGAGAGAGAPDSGPESVREAELRRLLEQERQARGRAEADAALFRSVFEAGPGKVVVLRPDDYTIVAASDSYLEATCQERHRIQGRPLFEVFPPDAPGAVQEVLQRVRESLERVKASGTSDVLPVHRYPILEPGGAPEDRWWSTVSTPVRNAAGGVDYIIHSAEDVTEFVREAPATAAAVRSLEDRARHLAWDVMLRAQELQAANQRLEQHAALLRNAQRLVRMGSWESPVDGSPMVWSDAMYAIYGADPARFVPTRDAWFGLIHPADREAVRQASRAVRDGHGPLDLVHRIVRADGSVRHVHAVAEITEGPRGRVVAGALQDVTEQVQAAADTAAAIDLIRIAGRIAQVGGWRFDLVTGRLQWTAETCAIHGVAEGTAPSARAGLQYFLAEDRDRVASAFVHCITEGALLDQVGRIRGADGRLRWVRLIGEPERDLAGRITGARGAVQDLSEVVAIKEHSQQLARRLQQTLESIDEGFLLLDADFCISFVNAEAERFLQRPRESLLGRHVWTEYPDVGLDVREAYTLAMSTGSPVELESSYQGRWLRLKAHPTSEGLAVYFRDVTTQRRVHEELLLLQSAVARQSDMVMITAAEAGGERKIVYVNDAFVRRTGYERPQVLGRTPRILDGPLTDVAELARVHRAIERGEPVRAERVAYTRSGEPFWVEVDIAPMASADGTRMHWVAVQRDITERRDAEQRARLSDERFQLLARATNDVIWDWDLVHDTIWWSEAFATLFGHVLAQRQPDSSSWTGHIFPADRARVVSGIHAALAGDASHWSDEYRFGTADGRWVEVIDRGFVLRNAEGRAVRMIGSMMDVSAMKRLEEQLRQAQRLDAVGQLTGGVAHDFNNLLTVILGNAEILAEELASQPALQALAETTLHAAGRGAELTSRLLSFARRQALHPACLDINALVAGMVGLVRRTLGEQLRIEIVPGTALWPAHADAAQLEAAILNLCLNARDAMGSGGRLLLATANVVLAPGSAPVAAGVAPGDYVMVSVADTGRGMDPATLARAFEPFFTTKEVGKGSGLGLSMVYGFAKQSRGHVAIESAPGQGTLVRLYLPRDRQPQAPAGQPAPVREAAPGGGESILLVEDEATVREHVGAQLQALGYRVRAVGQGREALAALAGQRHDLLFTDVVMPGGMGGAELAEAARRLQPGLPVLFTSGYAQDAALRPPDIQLLLKPYRRQELAAAIRAALGPR